MDRDIRKIAILGSTGSIGTQTLEIVRANPQFRVTALSAGHNIGLLEKQIREFSPQIAAVWGEEDANILRTRTADLDVRIVSGMEGMILAAADTDARMVVTAVVGMIGIRPTIAAINAGKDIALANKETLVTAGHIIMPLAKEKGIRIYPVDSEHSAIFQSLNGEDGRKIRHILLTASGGPFRGMTKEQLRHVRLEDALKHPNWSMGHKITIDSASMVNKGLEVMEAKWLFDVSLDQIEVVIQPQSVIHSMVEFVDGAVIAQLGTPDMKLPIQYALFGAARYPLAGERLDLGKLKMLTFEKPDPDTFEGLALALEAAGRGGTMPVVFNAANEEAVAMFLRRQISFVDIYRIIRSSMERHTVVNDPDVERILQTEEEVRGRIRSEYGRGSD